MILRKPYALFIKYFKFMHLVLTVLIAYLMYKTGFLYTFLNEKITSVNMTPSYDITSTLFNFYMFVIPFIIIVFNLFVLSVLIFKKKPYKFYIFSTLVYVAVIFLNGYYYDVLETLETSFVDVRTLRLVRDFVMFTLVFEFLTIIKAFISATGFDVKRLDFRKDLEELNIAEEDREEFEVEVKIDTDLAKRTIRGRIRHLRYFYLENRFLVNLLGLVAISFVSFTIYFNLTIYNKILNENNAFSTGNISFMVSNSYITNTDYKLVPISDDYSLVVVEISARNNYEMKNNLDISRMQLSINDHKYLHSNKYRDRLMDLGISYDGRDLTTNFNKYLLVYEVPKIMLNKEMIFMYYDIVNYAVGDMKPSIIKVRLDTEDLEKNYQKNSTEFNKVQKLLNPFKDLEMKIDSYEIEKYFALSYDFCLSKDSCIKSKEYLTPSYSSNTNLMLLKLTGSFVLPESIKHVNYADFYSIYRDFGFIEYETKGVTKTFKIKNNIKSIKTNTKSEFIEVPEDVKLASKISLVLNVRNIKYVYVLK